MPRTTNTSCFFISIIFLWDLKALEALVSENFGSWLGTRKIIWKSGKGAAFPEYSSLSLSIAPTRLLLLSHPAPSANCPSKPNYPLTNRVQSLVIALTITISLSCTIYATGLRPFRCDYIPSIAVINTWLIMSKCLPAWYSNNIDLTCLVRMEELFLKSASTSFAMGVYYWFINFLGFFWD